MRTTISKTGIVWLAKSYIVWSLLGFCDCGDKVFSFPFMLMMLLPSHGEDQQTPRQTISSQAAMMTMIDMMITIETGSRPKGIFFNTFKGDLRVRGWMQRLSLDKTLQWLEGERDVTKLSKSLPFTTCLSVCSSESICLREEFLDCAVWGESSLLSPQADWYGSE